MSQIAELKARHENEIVELLGKRLAQCTERQQVLFHKIFPDGPSPDQLEDAIKLVERTLDRNL